MVVRYRKPGKPSNPTRLDDPAEPMSRRADGAFLLPNHLEGKRALQISEMGNEDEVL
jgi:hypothetical protein